MKEQDKIPTGKIKRASKFMSAGAKVGGNYLKHYSKKVLGTADDAELHKDNAEDIYQTLSQLKGSALKVAQMLSMNDALPEAYNTQFAMGQYNAPPLSYPLVVKTIQKNLGKGPNEIFDSFTKQAVNAASIGQVHQAKKGDKLLAVKVQYPGIADSIHSDLKMVKPFATTLMNIKKEEVDYFMEEVEGKLIEETDYELELKQSLEISEACAHLSNLHFTKYYPEFSSKQVLTMEWIDGTLLHQFLQTNPSQEFRNKVGQAIWDFYMHQIHVLRKVHADPHPGNFLIRKDETVAVIDFGCVKTIPDSFYETYFKMLRIEFSENNQEFIETLFQLNMLLDSDTKEQQDFFVKSFAEIMQLVGEPMKKESFDFGHEAFFKNIFEKGKALGEDKRTRQAKAARGLRDAIYVNRTHMGLYGILHELRAEVKTFIPSFEKK